MNSQKQVLEDIQKLQREIHDINQNSTSWGPQDPGRLSYIPTYSPTDSVYMDTEKNSYAPQHAGWLLLQASQSSFGSFVATDSKYGNSIMPVLPRVDTTMNHGGGGGVYKKKDEYKTQSCPAALVNSIDESQNGRVMTRGQQRY